MMIVSLDWEKPCHSRRGEEASFVHCAGRGGTRGRAGRYRGMPPPGASRHAGAQNAGSQLKTLPRPALERDH